ncbi:UNVERIFIED_CONTAM: 40S ribosomal protein [Siphonaria sp. JEL0065]|nr:40S ribosomal protein [Siphonaria sp. JEL0065]
MAGSCVGQIVWRASGVTIDELTRSSLKADYTNEGISRDSRHKRNATGAKRAHYRKKRKFELGRQAANTKIGAKRVHAVRVRGGNTKFRALRLEAGNFAWGSEHTTRKTRVISVKYNSTNNELVRTNTLVKGAIVEIDATPFRQWFESHYALPIGRRGKKPHEGHEEGLNKPRSNHVTRKVNERKEGFKVEQALDDQFVTGRVLARITSRPGQSGRCDGYVLEGKELDFYLKKIRSKGKH